MGKPPFETESLRDTYSKIKKNEYNIPFNLNDVTQDVIRGLLHSDATMRPSMTKLLQMPYFQLFIPTGLPTSVMTTVPRYDNVAIVRHNTTNKPPLNNIGNTIIPIISGIGITGTGHDHLQPGPSGDADLHRNDGGTNKHIGDLQRQIAAVLDHAKLLPSDAVQPNRKMLDLMEESEEPTLAPVYWVSKWVDYSDRYGLGYQLSDCSNGVVFNDVSRIILTANCQNLQYIEKNGTEHLHTISNYPAELNKKVTLLQYFQTYMIENLMTVSDFFSGFGGRFWG